MTSEKDYDNINPQEKGDFFMEQDEMCSAICDELLSQFDRVLVGQKKVKKLVAYSILSNSNSRILLTGGTGYGKSTLSDFLATRFKTVRISMTSDLLPCDIQELLKRNTDLRLLQIEEFNRASEQTQSALIELFSKGQMTIDGNIYSFRNLHDFYVIATQNDDEIAGMFPVPLAMYDRFDVSIAYDELSRDEMEEILFGNHSSNEQLHLLSSMLDKVQKAVNQFQTNKIDQNMMLTIFEKIDSLTIDNKKLFAGSNVRAHLFALKLVKLMALTSGRTYLLPTDIIDFIESLYMHRINQNVAQLNDEKVKDLFERIKIEIKEMQREKSLFEKSKSFIKSFNR